MTWISQAHIFNAGMMWVVQEAAHAARLLGRPSPMTMLNPEMPRRQRVNFNHPTAAFRLLINREEATKGRTGARQRFLARQARNAGRR